MLFHVLGLILTFHLALGVHAPTACIRAPHTCTCLNREVIRIKCMTYLKSFARNKHALHFLLLIRKASNSIMLGRHASIQNPCGVTVIWVRYILLDCPVSQGTPLRAGPSERPWPSVVDADQGPSSVQSRVSTSNSCDLFPSLAAMILFSYKIGPM